MTGILSAFAILVAALCAPSELSVRVEHLAAPARGHVGVAARVAETGERVALHASDRFPMQSVYKLGIDYAVFSAWTPGGCASARRSGSRNRICRRPAS